jgi:glycosyltransferase involved in cell wall biosynthesis
MADVSDTLTLERRAAPIYRVLMIAPTSFFADYGCHVRILEEARVLQKRGHQVTVCTYHNGRDLPGLQILRSLSVPWRRDYAVGSSRHKIGLDVLLSWRALTAMLQVRPHIIHAHLHEGALIGWALSKLFGAPLVFDFQGSLTGEMVDHGFLHPEGRFFRPMRRLERLIDRASPRILTSSAHAADLLCRDFACNPDRITQVPDCVNTDVFTPQERTEDWARFKRSWNIPTERIVVVYLGLLAEYQGIGHLLRAAQMICRQRDDVHFLLGGYPNIEYYRQLAQELGIADHVSFTGQVAYEQAPRVLSLGDIAVSPKLSKTEGAGKLLNYMAMALPTVVFDTQVSREYLGAHGVYAKRGDSDDLARCLIHLADHRAQAESLGQALRRRAEQLYSWESAADTMEGLYADLLAHTS